MSPKSVVYRLGWELVSEFRGDGTSKEVEPSVGKEVTEGVSKDKGPQPSSYFPYNFLVALRTDLLHKTF